MTVRVEFLKSIPYFSKLSPAELDPVSQLVFERTVERGEIIVFEGDPAEALFLVVSGAVKVFKTSTEGKEQILSIARPGESFNDVPIFDGSPNPASAQAMSPVLLYGIRRAHLEGILRHHQQVALNVIGVLAARVRQLLALVEDLSFKHVIGRVAKILIEHAGDEGGARPRLTQQEMAAIAGTSREVVARSLKSLEEDGVIKFERHRILITDKKALEEMVQPSS